MQNKPTKLLSKFSQRQKFTFKTFTKPIAQKYCFQKSG